MHSNFLLGVLKIILSFLYQLYLQPRKYSYKKFKLLVFSVRNTINEYNPLLTSNYGYS